MHLDDYELPMAVFDELVMYRYAQLIESGLVREVEERLRERGKWGNYGTHAFARMIGEDPDAQLRSLGLDSSPDGRTD